MQCLPNLAISNRIDYKQSERQYNLFFLATLLII